MGKIHPHAVRYGIWFTRLYMAYLRHASNFAYSTDMLSLTGQFYGLE